MRLAAAGLTLFAVLIPEPLLAVSQSDIVWPTYDQAQRNTDAFLDCSQLQSQIAHVRSDITLLNKAQVRIEDVLRSAFDMERYGGSNGPGGQRISAGIVEGKESYAAARQQIVASLRVAVARRDYLKSLEPDCRPAPQQTPALPKQRPHAQSCLRQPAHQHLPAHDHAGAEA